MRKSKRQHLPMLRARDNPFQSDRIERVRYRFPDRSSLELLLQRLKQLDYRGALVGPEGSGKTTLLEELHARIQNLGYCTWLIRARAGPAGVDLPLQFGKNDVLLIDSAERLSWLEWRRLKWASRSAGGLVITSHRPGLLPTLLECRTTPALFRGIVRELTSADDFNRLPPEHLGQLFAAHQGNIRGALRELYNRANTGGSEPEV